MGDFDNILLGVEKTIQEALVIDIDPGSGNVPSTIFTTQAEVDANGAVATVADALEALPNILRYPVTFELADGTHTLDGRGLGVFGRFQLLETDIVSWPAVTGKFTIRSKNGLKRVAGTTAMNVLSQASDGNYRHITLTADPGLAANLYRLYFLRVVSGTGAGVLHPIRKHSGAIFSVLDYDQTLPNATSVVEIVEASAIIDYSSSGLFVVEIFLNRDTYYAALEFREVDIDWGDTWAFLEGGFFDFDDGCRIYNHYALSPTSGAVFYAQLCIVDGSSSFGSGMIIDNDMPGGGFARLFNGFVVGNITTGIYGFEGYGITIRGMSDSAPASVYMFRAACENCGGSGIKVFGKGAKAHTDTKYRCGDVQGHGITLTRGGAMSIVWYTDANYGTGVLGDLEIDGETLTWLEACQAKYVHGKDGSRFFNAEGGNIF